MNRLLRTAILGSLALSLTAPLAACGGGKERPRADLAASKVTTIGVNAIVTDWYVNPNLQTERTKLTVAILDQDLRADALRVSAQRQVNRNGQWVDSPVEASTVQKIEDIILTRARDLRRAAIVEN